MVGTCDGSGAKAISGAELGITIVCANTGSGFVSADAGAIAWPGELSATMVVASVWG